MKPKAKAKSCSSNNASHEAWGLGLLLVFFFDEQDNNNHEQQQQQEEEDPKCNFHRRKKKQLPSSSSFLSPFISNHNHHLLISRAQSTISICALIFFFTLLLFTLSTFEPNNSSSIPSSSSSPIRSSQSKPKLGLGFSRRWLSEKETNSNPIKKKPSSSISVALQGMGTLFRRGTRAMNNLLVAHLTEDTTDDELRLFLRSLHRSALMAKSDLVFIFPSSVVASPIFSTAIQEENESFLKLVRHYRNRTGSTHNGFDLSPFTKTDRKVEKKRVRTGGATTVVAESLWGRKGVESDEDELNGLSYGSVVGFEAGELDPEEALSGFFLGSHSPPPTQLRRWACYPMLLGRVRRNFKHVMLASVKNVVIGGGDALDRVKNHGAELVYLWKQSKQDARRLEVTADAIMGGIRGVRRLSNAMLNEIVRAAIRASGRSRNSSSTTVSESVILSQFVKNESLMKKLEVVVSVVDEMAELTPIPTDGGRNKFLMAECGGTNKNHSTTNDGGGGVRCILTKEICSSTLDSSSIYKGC